MTGDRRGWRVPAWVWGLSAFAAMGSCLRPSEERAAMDSAVGLAEVGGVSLRVEDGLAAVRVAEPGLLRLWAQAPQLTVELEADAQASPSWVFEVWNCMPDAELVALGQDGMPLVVQALEDDGAPTRKRWGVELLPGQAATLLLGPPDAQDEAPWRFAVLSDVQEDVDRVDQIFARVNEDPSVRFVLSSGDLTRQGEASELERFQDELLALEVPLYSTVGNHELGTEPEVWHRLFGRFNTHFWFKGVAFSLVDSGSATLDPTVYRWLDGWLKDSAQEVHVFVTHIVPIDPIGTRNGSFRSRKEAGKLLKMLADGQVDVGVYGHVHSFYGFSLAGVPMYISGGGGAIPERLDGIERHYLVVDVRPGEKVDRVGVVRVD